MNKENNNSKICPICGRPTHKESKYCIFHASKEEKTEDDFKKALKEYVNKIKKKDSDYHFEKFIFVGYINIKEDLNIDVFKNVFFSETIFEGIVFFSETTFEGKADFFRTIFKGETYFTGASFEGKVDFTGASFEGKVDFTGATFEGNTDFTFAAFKGNAYFAFATFKGNANFEEATFKISTEFTGAAFEGDANFEDTTFEGHDTYFMNAIFEGYASFFIVTFKGNTNFEDATFKGNANFEEATFEGDSGFRLKYLDEILNFSKIKTLSGKKLFIRLNNKGGEIFFTRAYLENNYLDIELVEGILIDFSDALLKNTKIKRGQIENHILQEKEGQFSKAQEIYLLLKNNFHGIGQYEDESWAFKKEKDMNRFSNSFGEFINNRKKKNQFKKILLSIKKNLGKKIILKFKLFKKWLFSKKAIKWFNLSFSNFIFQYGENPWYVIRFASIVILFFSVLLNITGIVRGDRTYFTLKQIEEMQGGNILKYSGPIIGNFLNCLYFSVVTFTTLGYGDFQPLEGWSRFLVSSEALLGAFAMALFVYTFARKTGGR